MQDLISTTVHRIERPLLFLPRQDAAYRWRWGGKSRGKAYHGQTWEGALPQRNQIQIVQTHAGPGTRRLGGIANVYYLKLLKTSVITSTDAQKLMHMVRTAVYDAVVMCIVPAQHIFRWGFGILCTQSAADCQAFSASKPLWEQVFQECLLPPLDDPICNPRDDLLCNGRQEYTLL